MLFNSEIFIFLFLPLTLFGFYGLSYLSAKRCAVAWLVFMSCVFYGWFRLDYLLLLLLLIVINYKFGILLSTQHKKGCKTPFLLICGLLINLGVLFYYKYSNFALSNINTAFGTHYILQNIVMPIGISFFIFQKIAYLVDAYRGEAEEYNFLDFCLFVMYFPQLIAGPIVHHKELIPQFRQPSIFKFNPTDMSIGLTMFIIGLCKKIIIADQLALWVDAPFQAVQSGWGLSFLEAWAAALTFTLQIYFDFSGYTDMALGLALMMGIRLPLNFNSPYKALNIIDFWRRWHMTLSRFLRDYVYISLGGNRKGSKRRYINLLGTMLIGGLWHGAAWTFLFWGALHGFYLIINHQWHQIKKRYGLGLTEPGLMRRIGARGLMFFSVLVAWVFFRADSFKAAIVMLKGMLGLNGVVIAAKYETSWSTLKTLGIRFDDTGVAYLHGVNQFLFGIALYGMIWLLPNTQQICAAFRPALEPIKGDVHVKNWWRFLPFLSLRNNAFQLAVSPVFGSVLALTLLAMVVWQVLRATPIHQFIYFQF